MLFIALLAAAATAQQAPALGSEITVRGQTYIPQLWLSFDRPHEPAPGLYRRVEHDWRARRLQTGAYPGPAWAARREGRVGVRLVVDTAGRLRSCTVTQPSGAASLDRHACPHLMRYGSFRPALDDRGRRVAQTVEGRMNYNIVPWVISPVYNPGDGTTPPRPLRPIDAATLGIGASTRRPPNVDMVGALVAVDAEGAVTACTLDVPTFDDAIDREICDRLRRDVRFQPGRDGQGRPRASTAHVFARWPGA